MNQVTLYTRHDESLDDPERDPCWAALAEYDPNDPASLLRARQAVRDQFSLPYLPTLCNDREPGFWEGIFGAMRRLTKQWRKQWPKQWPKQWTARWTKQWPERKAGAEPKRAARVVA